MLPNFSGEMNDKNCIISGLISRWMVASVQMLYVFLFAELVFMSLTFLVFYRWKVLYLFSMEWKGLYN